MSQKYNKLNNLFRLDQDFDDLKRYLETGQVPPDAVAWRYRKRAEGFRFDKDKDEILYEDLVLVAPRDRFKYMGLIYHDPNNQGIGKGIVGFYKLVRSKYVGITRDMAAEYLRDQAEYQLTRPITRRVNKPIVSKYPNGVWGVDLVDCNHFLRHNRGWRYIMTVVDIFSRKIWLQRLKQKEASNTATAFKSICVRARVNPNQLIVDNGTEFAGEFETLCKDRGITIRHTISHNPQSNGITERANQEVRKIMRALMVRNEDLIWYNRLTQIEDSKNNSYSGPIKSTPNEVWAPGKVKLPDRQLPDDVLEGNPRLKARKAVLESAKAKIRQFKSHEYQVGDLVRVRMTALFANMRAKVKAGDTKNIVVTHSPQIFRVQSVVKPHNELLERQRYVLENEEGMKLFNPGEGIKQFYAIDLLAAENDSNFDLGMTTDDALRLNKIDRTREDVTY